MSAQVRPRNRFPMPVFPVFGARLRSATTTIIAIGVVALAILLAAWINWQARQTADRVSHAIEIRERAERFLGRMRDAETGQRGFLLTGRPIISIPSPRAGLRPGPNSTSWPRSSMPIRPRRNGSRRCARIWAPNSRSSTGRSRWSGPAAGPRRWRWSAAKAASPRWTGCARPSRPSSRARTSG